MRKSQCVQRTAFEYLSPDWSPVGWEHKMTSWNGTHAETHWHFITTNTGKKTQFIIHMIHDHVHIVHHHQTFSVQHRDNFTFTKYMFGWIL